MKDSWVVSRPPRRARSGVTYKESDDDDEEFVPNAKVPTSDAVGRRSSVSEVEELGVARGKRTLTLRRARTVEPPSTVGKEGAHGHAIPDEEKPALSPDYGRGFHAVVDPAQSVPSKHRESIAFECLLEAVSGASADGEDEDASVGKCFSSTKKTGQSESRKEEEGKMTSTAYDFENAGYATYERKVLAVKGMKSEDTDGTDASRRFALSYYEESRLANSSVGKGMKDTSESERYRRSEHDGISSADDKKYSRRGERGKHNSMSSAEGEKAIEKVEEDRQESMACVLGKKNSKESEEDMQDGMPLTYGKKDRKAGEENMNDVPSADEVEEDDEDYWNESSDASDVENKRPVKGKSNIPSPAKKPSQELKTFVKKTKVTKKDLGTPGRVILPAKSTSVPTLLPKKRPALWVGTKSFVPPGPLNLPSPIVAHRRVVGLSRRHRPPPLHPYLLGS